MVVRSEKAFDDLAGDVFSMLEALPEFIGRGEAFKSAFKTGREVVLNNSVAVGGISELQPEDLCVLHRLTEAVGGLFVIGLRFDDGDSKIGPIPEEIVGPFLLTADRAAADHNDAAIGEGSLFVNVVIRPARRVELREDVFSTGISFRKYRHASEMTAFRIVTPNRSRSILAGFRTDPTTPSNTTSRYCDKL
jgi:hypothetical protein